MFSIICVCFLFACGNKVQEKKFFDVPGYFKKEIEGLKKSNFMVSKMAIYNGDTSQQQTKASETNWEKEFAIFLEADINKPAYYANMRESDGSANDTNAHKKIYTSESLQNSIQLVEVDFRKVPNQDDIAEFIHIKLEKSNLISVTSINAFYSKGKKYVIEGNQKIKQLGGENSFKVEGLFYK